MKKIKKIEKFEDYKKDMICQIYIDGHKGAKFKVLDVKPENYWIEIQWEGSYIAMYSVVSCRSFIGAIVLSEPVL